MGLLEITLERGGFAGMGDAVSKTSPTFYGWNGIDSHTIKEIKTTTGLDLQTPATIPTFPQPRLTPMTEASTGGRETQSQECFLCVAFTMKSVNLNHLHL